MALDLIREYKNTQQELKEIDKLKQENTSLKQNVEALKQRIIDLQDEKLANENKVNVQLAKAYSDPEAYTKYVDKEAQAKITSLENQIKSLTQEKTIIQEKMDEISNYIKDNKKKSAYAFKMANKVGSIRGEKFEGDEDDGSSQ